ncbi:MAG: hypothetical protein ACLQNE_43575 [Thermoguttaceae bacterium]
MNDPANLAEDNKTQMLRKVAKRLRQYADRTKAAILPIGAKLVSLRSMMAGPRFAKFARGGTSLSGQGGTSLSAAKGVSCGPTTPVVPQGVLPKTSPDNSEANVKDLGRLQDQRPAIDPAPFATTDPSNGRAAEPVPSPGQPGEQFFDPAGPQDVAGKYRRGLARLAATASQGGKPIPSAAMLHQGAFGIGTPRSPDAENEGLGKAMKKLQAARSPLAAAGAGLGGPFPEPQTTQAGWAEATTRLRNLLEGGIPADIRRSSSVAQEQFKGQPGQSYGQIEGSPDGGTRIPDSGASANPSSEPQAAEFAKQQLDEAKQLNRTQSQMLDWFKQNLTGRQNKEPATAG